MLRPRMSTQERTGWISPALMLCGFWLIGTGVFVALAVFAKTTFPSFVAKSGPFIVAGLLTGRFLDVDRRTRVLATLVLVVFSALGWTSFSFVTSDLPWERLPLLFFASVPVFLVSGVWAYFGMFLSRRRDAEVDSDEEASDAERIELELQDEIVRDLASDSKDH